MEQELLGRDVEVARIYPLIDQTPDGGAVLIAAGEPGIGKSALLRVGADHARGAGLSVFESTGIESESKPPYSSLNQLLSPVLDYADRLPTPQRRALAVALGREDGEPPGPSSLLSPFSTCRPSSLESVPSSW
jgi:AAA ATPase domain